MLNKARNLKTMNEVITDQDSDYKKDEFFHNVNYKTLATV